MSADIQAGGRPRRFPEPRASLSIVKIASSIACRSCLNSARIFVTSMFCSLLRVAGAETVLMPPDFRFQNKRPDPENAQRSLYRKFRNNAIGLF
ncbi:MAG: hypothetical protein HXY18_13280 [Bryobacteraceae bacterium]|nr:hypothetical protein [Bryobacteraceae bacterium]